MLVGPSGVGKTEFQKAFHERFSIVFPKSPCALYHIQSAAHGPHHLIANMAVQLCVNLSDEDSDRSFRDALNLFSRENTAALLIAGALDLLDHGAPNIKKTAAALLETLKKSSDEASLRAKAERLIKVGSDDLVANFHELLKGLPQGGLIQVDQFENGSGAVQSIVTAIAANLPASWSTILSVNDETIEGVRSLESLLPPFLYAGGQVAVLPPISEDAFTRWLRSEKLGAFNAEEVSVVHRNCQGRPLFLQDWVSGLVSTYRTKFALGERISAFYQRRETGLSRDALFLLRRLSTIPYNWNFPFSFCHELHLRFSKEATVDSTYDALHELERANFLKRDPSKVPDAFSFTHEVTKAHLVNQLPQEVVRAAASDVLQCLTELSSSRSAELAYVRLVLTDQARSEDLSPANCLAVAVELLEIDAYEPALRALNICISANVIESELVLQSARFCKADICVKTGKYQEALDLIREVQGKNLSEQLRNKASLLSAEALLRLNRYEEAVFALQEAYNGFGDNDPENQLLAELHHNTILRDLEHYDLAVTQARQLLAKAKEKNLSPLMIARCGEALVRSLAFQGAIDEACPQIQEALSLASEPGGIRTTGNCHLALGEALRHSGRHEEALDSYREAARIARLINNVDSLLWSLLGLSDCFFLADEYVQARLVLDQVGTFVANASEKYPLEHLHWSLSQSALDFKEGKVTEEQLRSVCTGYDKLNIDWPTSYVGFLCSPSSRPPPKGF